MNTNKSITKQCKLCNAEMPKRSKKCNQCGAQQKLFMTAKLNPCRKCGAQISTDVNKCPHCGAVPTKFIVSYILVALVVALMFVLIFAVANSNNDSATSNDKTTVQSNDSGMKKGDLIYEDDRYKISFIKFEDPNLGVTTFNLYLKVENKTDREIIAMLTDGYANDTAIQFMTGLPVKIEPGKNAVGAFVFGYNNLGFDTIEDVEKIEFNFTAYNSENYDTIFETEKLSIEF